MTDTIQAVPAREVKLARSWRHRCPGPVRLLIAILLVGIAWGITFGLRHLIDAPSFQTPFFVCAIVLSSWIGGAGPGITATLLSIFAIEYSFTEPRYTIGFTWSEVPKFTVFFLAGGFISLLARRQRRDEEALLVARESLEEKVCERTAELETANVQLTAEIAERKRAESALQRLNRAWRVRGMLNRSVARSADEQELASRACQALIRVGGYQLAWLASADNGVVRAEAHASVSGFQDKQEAWAAGGTGHTLAAKSMLAGVATACTLRDRSPDLPKDAWAARNGVKAVLALPLISEGGIMGVLMVYSEEWDAFDKKEADLLQEAANDMAQGIALFRTRAAKATAETALKRTQEELERVARATTMGELTASIAHEINQPLAAVVTNANACLRWLDREPPELDEARETARRIIRDGKRGSEVLARIRALLKNEAPKHEPLAVNEVVEEILALTRSSMTDIVLVKNLGEDLPLVDGDRVQLQQVLLNLVLNAVEAMKDTEEPQKLLRLETRLTNDSEVEVTVADTGPGLAPEMLDRVFTTFFTTKANGLGMGLAICRSILEQHGGKLWAESDPGAGATFHFTIPLNPP